MLSLFRATALRAVISGRGGLAGLVLRKHAERIDELRAAVVKAAT